MGNPAKTFVIQKALHRIRTATGISAWYLALSLAADAQLGRLEPYFTGSTINHFTGQSLRSYRLPLPPYREQEHIVEEAERQLTIISIVENDINANLARCERLRQAILEQAFSGRLVPKDPNDEPASVLLEDIQFDGAKNNPR